MVASKNHDWAPPLFWLLWHLELSIAVLWAKKLKHITSLNLTFTISDDEQNIPKKGSTTKKIGQHLKKSWLSPPPPPLSWLLWHLEQSKKRSEAYYITKKQFLLTFLFFLQWQHRYCFQSLNLVLLHPLERFNFDVIQGRVEQCESLDHPVLGDVTLQQQDIKWERSNIRY